MVARTLFLSKKYMTQTFLVSAFSFARYYRLLLPVARNNCWWEVSATAFFFVLVPRNSYNRSFQLDSLLSTCTRRTPLNSIAQASSKCFNRSRVKLPLHLLTGPPLLSHMQILLSEVRWGNSFGNSSGEEEDAE